MIAKPAGYSRGSEVSAVDEVDRPQLVWSGLRLPFFTIIVSSPRSRTHWHIDKNG